jgi:uncharacterized protein YjbI with pentapeptide repeats
MLREIIQLFDPEDVVFLVSKEHIEILKKGVDVWNDWRQENPSIKPDLCEANLVGANLSAVNLSNANLCETNLIEANLYRADLSRAELFSTYLGRARLEEANLREADLTQASLNDALLRGANLSKAKLRHAMLASAYFSGANLSEAVLQEADLSSACLIGANLTKANLTSTYLPEANLSEANLTKANLRGANLSEANLTKTNLTQANLSMANMNKARIIGANLTRATLTNCRVFGISAWGLIGLDKAIQKDLKITPEGESEITVDNLEVAQFIYILLHSEKIRSVIDTITSKVVLILGRFTPERKGILDAIRDELRKRNYLPILFDFEKPISRDITETVSTLAHIARFVIADITEARSIPQELERIVPDLPSVPVQPILLASANEYGMFEHFKRYPWILKMHHYNDMNDLLKSLEQKVIVPAEKKAKELQKR